MLIRDFCSRFILLLSLLLIPSAGWCGAPEPGGKGRIDSDVTNNCFKTQSSSVVQVCASYHINWKMWVLAGEPVGDYNVAWKLVSVTLKDPASGRSIEYTPDTMPPQLKKAAGKIELYLDGYATLYSKRDSDPGYDHWLHRFNTGVQVRAGAGSSYNVPGSPHWNRLFAAGTLSICSDEARFQDSTYTNEKKAKAIFAKGIEKLEYFHACPKSGVSELSALEGTISELCRKKGAAEQYAFCPKEKKKEEAKKDGDDRKLAAEKHSGESGRGKSAKKNSGSDDDNLLGGDTPASKDDEPIADILDEDAERPQVQARLEQMRAAYRPKAEAACQSTKNKLEQCLRLSKCTFTPVGEMDRQQSICAENVCGRRPDKRLRVCSDGCEGAVPEHPDPNTSYICIPRCGDGGPNPEYDTWKLCADRATQCRVSPACEKECNPEDYQSQGACVEYRMAHFGPTAKDARAQLKKKWDANAHSPKKSRKEKGDDEPTNFLD